MKIYKTDGSTVVLHRKGLRVEPCRPAVAEAIRKSIDTDFKRGYFDGVVAKQGADFALLGPKTVGNERYR